LVEQGYDEEEINEILYGEYEESSDNEIEIDLDFSPTEDKPYQNEYACRLKPPGDFDKFSRINCFKKSDGKCIDYIFGIKDGKTKVQAMRYKKKIWSEKDSRAHCSAHDGDFEA
ncbi:MAG: hypothetical protein P8012_14140, partial [Desulfobacterales bacterium]